jgi:hypothetical protein
MTIRRWMGVMVILAIVITAIRPFATAVRAATRPIPRGESVEIATGRTYWSDGVVTSGYVPHYEVARPVKTDYVLFCRVVRWSDGSVSFRLPSRH